MIILRKKYFEITKEKNLGGSVVLEELAELIFRILKKAPSKHFLLLFVLYKIFTDISMCQERRMVELKEARQLYNKLNKFIENLLKHLEMNKKQEILLSDTVNLIKAYYFS